MDDTSRQSREEARAVLYDCDIREPLFDYLEERFGKTRMFEEKIIGRSRADILMLTEQKFIGLEIKSDADTYERLKRQVRDYDWYCDENYIVAGKSHEKHVAEHVPDYWGVLLVSQEDGRFIVEEQRLASPNPRWKKQLQITLLWRPELQHILEINRLPGYKEKSKRFVQQKLLEKMEWDILKSQMCEELFERDYTLWMEEETKRQRSLPRSKMIASKHKHIHIERESSKQVMP